MFLLRALLSLALLSSIPAYPMSQQRAQAAPPILPRPNSGLSTQTSISQFTIGRAPFDAVGDFLGRGGLETLAFETKCRSCCKKTIDALGKAIPFLRRCSACKIDNSLDATGECANEPLGFEQSTSECFRKRCSDMLGSAHKGCFCSQT